MAFPKRRGGVLVACLLLAVSLGGVASAASLTDKQLSQASTAALKHWRASLKAKGLVGLQAESDACIKALAKAPSQRQAVLCAALDHYSQLDAMNFPDALQPPYFQTDAVFARYDRIVALAAPPAERRAFASRLLTTLDETLHDTH